MRFREMKLTDFRHDMELCNRCSMCKFIPLDQIKGLEYSRVCPSVSKFNFHSYCGGGRLNFALALVDNRIGYTPEMLDTIYRCQMCGACDVLCKLGNEMEVFQTIQQTRIKCVEDGQIIAAHKSTIEGLLKEGNMIGARQRNRGDWAEDLSVKNIFKDKAEVYFHAGCRYCYDQELWPVAHSAVKLLQQGGVDVAIAGSDESCCRGRAYELGYQKGLEKYAGNLFSQLQIAGVRTIVTPCAECYYTFKVVYSSLGIKSKLEVLHITEYLERLIKERKIKLIKKVPMIVTYHDPCNLGRKAEPWIVWKGHKVIEIDKPILHEPPKQFRMGINGVYAPPRNILNSIPGLKFVEMKRIKEYAWCCGAGGGVENAYPDYARWTALDRIDEAASVGAEAIATACPWCEKMFRDSQKGNKNRLEVFDLVTLVERAI
jgi:Fe-S oxidoreductase